MSKKPWTPREKSPERPVMDKKKMGEQAYRSAPFKVGDVATFKGQKAVIENYVRGEVTINVEGRVLAVHEAKLTKIDGEKSE